MALVEAENLCRSFGNVKALDGLNFSVEQGEIFGLMGPDGAGKTTCLRILCGLMRPTSGRAGVLGKDVGKDPEAVKDQIGYMAQPAKLYEDLTVKENIELYADLYQVPRERYERRMKRLLDFSGLAPFTGRLFRDLSGGMKQKVGLSCALIHTPKVLFLDEPTNGVDPVSRRDFWKILYELHRENVTILVASTYLDEADRCHRVALFDRGKARLVMEPLRLRSLVKGHLFDLKTPERRKAMRVLKASPKVVQASLFGAGIHFSVREAEDLPLVEQELTASGLSAFRTEPIQPSLEDVYLSLVEGDRAP
ncbi:MAG: ABC transporter ATP-binding protein [Desulfobacterota bacterium]|jgi:ABC-2 type transport system ATP-binding protein|nr:ABC transporter ATP-binding protein [Thermodesulfobacteriota bacterium]